jgi:hypothetical protein
LSPRFAPFKLPAAVVHAKREQPVAQVIVWQQHLKRKGQPRQRFCLEGS